MAVELEITETDWWAEDAERLNALAERARENGVTVAIPEQVENVFCPTGEGGGIDPTCPAGGVAGGEHAPEYGARGGSHATKEARAAAMSAAKETAASYIKSSGMEGRALSSKELGGLAEHVAKTITPEDMRALQARCVGGTCPRTGERYTLMLHEDEHSSTYLLRWGEGQAAEWHDHGDGKDGARVGIHVLKGSPENRFLTSSGRIATQNLKEGQTYNLGAPYLHRVVDTGKESWTIHSYSGPKGPLNHMNFYKFDEDSKDLVFEGGKPVKMKEEKWGKAAVKEK